MTRKIVFMTALLVCAVFVVGEFADELSGQPGSGEKSCIVLMGGRLVDGNGGPPLENSVVIIQGNKIEALGKGGQVKIPAGADIIDIKGNTVMPGLIDAHLHFAGLANPSSISFLEPHELRAMRSVIDVWRVVDAGFTTVREAGGRDNISLRNAVDEGSIIGPRILACGRIITQTGGHADLHFIPLSWASEIGIGRIADGADECRKAAREQLREGADFLKLCSTGGVMSEKDLPTSSQFTLEEIKAIVEEGRHAGVKVASHAQGNAGIKSALRAGVDTIEHGFYLDDEAIEMMIKQNTYFIPTLAIVEAVVDGGLKAGTSAGSLAKAQNAQKAHIQSVLKAWKAGVKVGLGTDYLSGPLGRMGQNAAELEIYVKLGRTPMEAIVAATKINSEALGLADKLGTLEPGKLADIIVVKGDPLKDIRILRDKSNILYIYKGGKTVPRLNLS